MTTYSAKIGVDSIAFLTEAGGVLGQLGVHVRAKEGADTLVFDDRVLEALKELSPDHDGSITEGWLDTSEGVGLGEDGVWRDGVWRPGPDSNGVAHPIQIWIGGIGYPITVHEGD